MRKNLVWNNKRWQDIDDKHLSIKDRGLRFSDGIFETILIKKNKAILLKEHVQRLNDSLNLLNFKFNLHLEFLHKIINEGIHKLSLNDDEYGSIRINYTRGINKGRELKIYDEYNNFDLNNLWIEFYFVELNFKPISVNISQTEKRNEYSLLSKCKTFSYFQSILALAEANKNNFDDALMLNTKNELCCGTTFNLLLKRKDIWLTPRKESGCLPGIMVNQLLKLKKAKEDYLLPIFKEDDILIALNSLTCRQIKQVGDLKFKTYYDVNSFWEMLYI